MKQHFSVYWVTCVLAIFCATLASATTIVLPTDDQLVQKSPVILEGTVVSTGPIDQNGKIWTETIISVSRNIKGATAQQVTVREIGGIIEDRITKVFGTPEFTADEQVLLFLNPTPRGDYQTVDLFVGKFTKGQTLNGEPLWLRHEEGADVALLDSNFQPIAPRNVQRDATGFSAFVANRVAGLPAAASYGIENPVLADSSSPKAPVGIAAPDFTMISEPSIYRWFLFDNGGTAKWYSKGTQPGYTGGGVNEVQTAMSAWTGDSEAKIHYSYAGTESGTAGGLTNANGVNEILFNDPLNEISGSWNPSTGGVVGQGGFNGVSGSQSWTAPFTADATHTAGAHTAWNITEANLTIQDNVSPTQSVSSSMLAEICAHELGHTLGFGHSADSSALMYYMISPGGPTLRADDQMAAKWLYPNGTVTQPPPPSVPAAPSALSVSASGSNVTLHWTDNATNETAEQVWMAAGSGSFSQRATLAAGTTSTTLSGLSAGTYRFYVTASNSAGTSSASNTASATIAAQTPLSAAFGFSPSSPTAGQAVSFSDQSTGGVSSWSWSFGDGATSSAQNPSHSFANGGTYNVVLTVFRSSDGSSNTATHNVTVNAGSPGLPSVSAAFTYSPVSPTTGQSIAFSDLSTGSPTSRSWSFGDGATSTATNPSHAYGTAATYTVTLTVSNGSSSSTTSHTVTVNGTQPSSQDWRTLVPGAAAINGANNTVWRTELTIFNPGVGATVTLTFLPSAGGTVQSRTISLGSLQSVTWSNALLNLYGLSSGSGAIAIDATSTSGTPVLRVSSRTFTTGTAGTYGQGIPDVVSADTPPTAYLAGLVANASYRTNLGLVNRTSTAGSATLTLYGAGGNVVAQASISVPADNYQQGTLASYFPTIGSATFDALSLRVTSSPAGAINAFASVVDNRTQDPVYVQGNAPASGTQSTIASVGHVAGANGTFWRSDVTVFNPNSYTVSVTMHYLPAGSDDRNPASSSLSIGAGQTIILSDVAATRFGISNGTGALQFTWNGAGPVITSRTYTTSSNGGTYGQSVDPIPSWGSDLYVTGLRSDGNFRSNVGFVSSSTQSIGITATLLNQYGQTVATSNVTLVPMSGTQMSLAQLFPTANVSSLGNVTLHAQTNNGSTLFAYGSLVDNTSGDPVYFAGR